MESENSPLLLSPEGLRMLIDQNHITCEYTFRKVDPSNASWRLNAGAASVGFILRHSGEIMHLLTKFLGRATSVENTTMGFEDTGQGADITVSKELIISGYKILEELADSMEPEWWMEKVRAPIFGTVERFRVMAHILNHTSHHAGQIALTLSRASE